MILVYIFSLKSLVKQRIQKNVNRLLKNSTNEELLGEKEYEFTKEGIIEKGLHSKSELTWSSIEKFNSTDDYYLLYQNGLMAFVIPKSAVNQIEEFESLIALKVGNKN